MVDTLVSIVCTHRVIPLTSVFLPHYLRLLLVTNPTRFLPFDQTLIYHPTDTEDRLCDQDRIAAIT